MKIFRLLKFLNEGSIRVHFSQYGEDVILHKLFGSKFSEGFYVDVGAHHPFRQSNTAYLWLLGWNGINVDASKTCIKKFNKVRPDDLNIWSAVVDEVTAQEKSEITLYSNFSVDLGATCDPKLATERNTVREETVPCTGLKNIINNHAAKLTSKIELLNIDIEGFDEGAIQSIAEWEIRPKVICIEIYVHNIRDLLKSPACLMLESFGYQLIERVGLTAIFQLCDDEIKEI
jgi:FkbM family methyltransferase